MRVDRREKEFVCTVTVRLTAKQKEFVADVARQEGSDLSTVIRRFVARAADAPDEIEMEHA